jgi:hypothetical protein
MDLKLHRPRGACAVSGRPFVAGEPFFSALVRAGGDLDRLDVAAEAWTGPPDATLAWWRSAYPAADAAGTELAPVDVLLDVMEQLEDRADDEPLRYLLALQLVRRRALRIVDATAGQADAEELILACRKREREYRVRVVPPADAMAEGVEQRLMTLLWSGGAA